GTLVAMLGYGASVFLFGVEIASRPPHPQLWGMGGFFVVFLVLVMPWVRASFAALPEPKPGVASLKPRRLELFPGAFVWPYVAWAGIVVWLIVRGMRHPAGWVGPPLGLLGLLVLKPCLMATVREPEPLGDRAPEDMEKIYRKFRRRRVVCMYALAVLISLGATMGWALSPSAQWAGAAGALTGSLIGVYGGLFGVWADAQRYLIRRELAGLPPPE
ncbi:MAG: hypothetical protein OER88_06580, partial [Planctomycetota bacterium]|nr:hypothetical protein [Planctomycetota bacterium]